MIFIEKHEENLLSFKDSAINAANEQLDAHKASFSNTVDGQKTSLNNILKEQTGAITGTLDEMQKTSTKALSTR